jgi:hypothetical protein
MFASCAKQMYDSRMHAVCVRSAVRFFFLSIYLHVFQIIQLILPLTKFFFQCQARLWEAQLQCVCVCFFAPTLHYYRPSAGSAAAAALAASPHVSLGIN